MIRQLFRLTTEEPQLLADHLEAYSELLASELKVAVAQWRHQAIWLLLGYGCFAIAAIFSGTALMLLAAIPLHAMAWPWLLVVVPVSSATLGAWAMIAARVPSGIPPFGMLQRQWVADRMMMDAARAVTRHDERE